MYAGVCSFGLITVLPGRWGTGDAVDPTCSPPYIEPGLPPCAGEKCEVLGVIEGGAGAALLYTG